MAKYNYGLAGNSSHIHNSLWSADGKTPLFFDKKAECTHVAADAQQWVAGQLKYAKRLHLVPGALHQLLQALPGRAPSRRPRSCGAEDNRTAGFRLCGEGTKGIRMECRIGGADLNPYLAFAALIAAGLAGIDEKLELQKPFVGDAYQAAQAAGDPEDAARRDRDAGQVEDAEGGARRGCGRALCPHRATGSSSNTTAGSPTGSCTGGSRGIDASCRERTQCPVTHPRVSEQLQEHRAEVPMTETVKLKSPVDGSIYAERPVADATRPINAAVERARAAQVDWAETPIAERGKYMLAMLEALVAMNDEIVPELAWQMGRPVRYGGEFGGVKERTRYMVEIAEQALRAGDGVEPDRTASAAT